MSSLWTTARPSDGIGCDRLPNRRSPLITGSPAAARKNVNCGPWWDGQARGNLLHAHRVSLVGAENRNFDLIGCDSLYDSVGPRLEKVEQVREERWTAKANAHFLERSPAAIARACAA
jgi:hypothetical protein